MMIDTEDLIFLVEKHKKHLSLEIMKPLFLTAKGDCTNVPDCLLMYLMILDNKPRRVIEFSPMLGYSTRYLASAMKILGIKGSMFTVEISQDYFNRTQVRMSLMGLNDYCKVILGEAISQTVKEIKSRSWEKEVDFIFIDSNHSYQFGKKYIREVFPLLSEHCIVMVHDICGSTPETGPYSLDFRTSLRSLAPKYSEYRAVKEFLMDNTIFHTLTHPLFGGYWQQCEWRTSKVEASPCLDENQEFYDAFKSIVGYDLNQHRNFQHPNGLLFRL